MSCFQMFLPWVSLAFDLTIAEYKTPGFFSSMGAIVFEKQRIEICDNSALEYHFIKCIFCEGISYDDLGIPVTKANTGSHWNNLKLSYDCQWRQPVISGGISLKVLVAGKKHEGRIYCLSLQISR